MADKVVIFYNQFDQGWTETWYTNNALTPNSFGLTEFVNFFNASIAFRGPGCYIYGARWTNLAGGRVNFSQILGSTYQSAATISPEVTAVDWVIKVLAGTNQYKHVFLRGLFQPWVIRNATTGGWGPTPNLVSAVNKYMQRAAAAGFALQCEQNPVSNPGIFTGAVSEVAPHPTNQAWSIVTIPTAVVWAGVAPYSVRFGRVPRNDLPGFPRECPIVSFTAGPPGTITIPYRYRANTVTYFPQSMTATQLLYTYPQVTAPTSSLPGWYGISFQERKTGRAFGVPRGRDRVVVSRR